MVMSVLLAKLLLRGLIVPGAPNGKPAFRRTAGGGTGAAPRGRLAIPDLTAIKRRKLFGADRCV
jgi:hypothetical protein